MAARGATPGAARFFGRTGPTGIFPLFGRPDTLGVLDVRPYDWEERLTAVCLQGLVNRVKPRIYLIYDEETDRGWLEHYREVHGIRHRELRDFDALLARYAYEVDGYVLCDGQTMNVAQTWGALHRAVATSPRVARHLETHGLRELRDFRGAFRDRIEAYAWAYETLLPRCNPRILGHCCIDGPVAASRDYHPPIRDYLVACAAFTFDLSACRRDRGEYRLFERILASHPEGGVILGGPCARCGESEERALGERHRFTVLPSLESGNHTVHAGVRSPGFRLRQRHAHPRSTRVEDKVYVTFLRSATRAWSDGQRGRLPCTWVLQAGAMEMAPGQMEYYYRTRTAQDYFIAGPWTEYTAAGAADTLSKFDMRCLLITSPDPYGGCGETHLVDPPRRVAVAYVGHGRDVYDEVAKFATLVQQRPLFVAVYVSEGVELASLRGAMERLDPAIFRVVNADVLLQTITAAHARGRLGDLTPDSPGLRDRSRGDAARLWTDGEAYRRHRVVAAAVDLSPEDMVRELRALSPGSSPGLGELPDILGWETVDPLIRLLGPALQARGIHVTRIGDAVSAVLEAYADIGDIGVVRECYELWRDWLDRRVELVAMRGLSRRVVAVVRRLEAAVAEASGVASASVLP